MRTLEVKGSRPSIRDAVAIFAGVVVLLFAARSRAAQEPTLATVLGRAADYVADFHRRLSSLVAEERYVQDWRGGRTPVSHRAALRPPAGAAHDHSHETREGSESSGRFWIEPATGRVLMSELVAEPLQVRATIDVSFQSEPLLGMLVPIEMRERYEDRRVTSLVTGRATYGRFRQFQ